MSISLHTLTRGIGMGQKTIFTIKWIEISMIWIEDEVMKRYYFAAC